MSTALPEHFTTLSGKEIWYCFLLLIDRLSCEIIDSTSDDLFKPRLSHWLIKQSIYNLSHWLYRFN